MRNCPHCNIKVGGGRKNCPLCQNPLTGDENDELYWPDTTQKLGKYSMLWRIIVFIVLAVTVIMLAIDFLILNLKGTHFSLIVGLWGISALIQAWKIIRNKKNIPRILFFLMLHATILLLITAWYIGFMGITLKFIIPIAIASALIANFVFCIIDKGVIENALIYLICNLLEGIVPYIFIYIFMDEVPITWTICLLLSVLTFIGLAVFKGRLLLEELQRRLHI